MSDLRVLIVGASIAGPMAAYWFAKAGAKVTVIERFPRLRTGGQNVDIRTVGVTIMRKIPGMEAAVRAKKYELEGLSFVGDDGRPLAVMKSTGDPDVQSLVSEYEILRGDLARILVDLTKDNGNVDYIYGEQVASMQQKDDDGPVTVEFANGSPTSEFDLVVACDGATSRTRAIGLGCGVRDHITSINSWVAYFSIEKDLLKGSKVAQAANKPGGLSFGLGPDPSGVNRGFLWAVHPRNDPDATLPFRKAAEQGTDALKHYVSQHFGRGGWKCAEILDGMMESKDFYASEIVQVKVPSLHKGRFVLVGDAGYAPGPTGAGTSLAIAGAYLLAGEVSRHKGDLAAGLRAYEERMQPLIKDMQKIPPGIPGIMAPQTAWGIWLRNMVFCLVAWGMGFSGLFSWLGRFYASSFGGDKYGLPDYEWVA